MYRLVYPRHLVHAGSMPRGREKTFLLWILFWKPLPLVGMSIRLKKPIPSEKIYIADLETIPTQSLLYIFVARYRLVYSRHLVHAGSMPRGREKPFLPWILFWKPLPLVGMSIRLKKPIHSEKLYIADLETIFSQHLHSTYIAMYRLVAATPKRSISCRGDPLWSPRNWPIG